MPFKARSKHKYNAQSSSEISLDKNTSVSVLDINHGGWWFVEIESGDSGWFPGEYLTTDTFLDELGFRDIQEQITFLTGNIREARTNTFHAVEPKDGKVFAFIQEERSVVDNLITLQNDIIFNLTEMILERNSKKSKRNEEDEKCDEPNIFLKSGKNVDEIPFTGSRRKASENKAQIGCSASISEESRKSFSKTDAPKIEAKVVDKNLFQEKKRANSAIYEKASIFERKNEVQSGSGKKISKPNSFQSEASFSLSNSVCIVCYDRAANMKYAKCGHAPVICEICLKSYISNALESGTTLKCIDENCEKQPIYKDISDFKDELMRERFTVRNRTTSCKGSKSIRFVNCSSCNVQHDIGGESILICRNCGEKTCIEHQSKAYPKVKSNGHLVQNKYCCQEAEIVELAEMKKIEDEEKKKRFEQLCQSERLKESDCKYCPHCNIVIWKCEGCYRMVCGKDFHGNVTNASGCGREFDWDKAKPYRSTILRTSS
jgi:hypothetical protein